MTRPGRRAAAITGLSLWIFGGAAAITSMLLLGDERSAAPPLDPGAWHRWATSREGIDAVVGVTRLITIAALGYLIAVALIHLLAIISGSTWLQLHTARLNPRPIAALTALAVLGVAPAAGAGPSPTVPVEPGQGADMIMVDRTPDSSETTTTAATPTTATPTTATPTPATPTTATPTTVPRPTTPAHPTTLARPAPQSVPALITVEPGDHLWSIAQRRVRLALGTEPSESEIRPYWQALIDANRDRLVERDNPDLLLPGQELVLPG